MLAQTRRSPMALWCHAIAQEWYSALGPGALSLRVSSSGEGCSGVPWFFGSGTLLICGEVSERACPGRAVPKSPHGCAGLEGLPARIVCEHRHFFTFSRRQAAVGGVQNDLVLPALLARRWKHFPAFDCGSETVCLPRVGKLVGNGFFSDPLSVAPQFQLNRPFNIQRILGPEDTGFADNLQRRAIVGTS